MGLGQHLPHHLHGGAGVHEIVDHQNALAVPGLYLRRKALENAQGALTAAAVAGDGDGLDHACAQFAGDDGGGHEAATGDADNGAKGALTGEPPRKRAGIPMKLIPGNGKRLCLLLAHDALQTGPHTKRKAQGKAHRALHADSPPLKPQDFRANVS